MNGPQPKYDTGSMFRSNETGAEFRITHRFLNNLVLKNDKTGQESYMIVRHLREKVEDEREIEYLGVRAD